jgi:mono/diheme cytochrome c family protein
MRSKPGAAGSFLVTGILGFGLAWMAHAQTDENLGARSLFDRYCAECHGPGGHGDGPAAPGLQPPPADLTRSTLSRSELIRVIDGRRPLKGHGSGAMPAWGPIFSSQAGASGARTSEIRVEALADEVLRLREGAAKPEVPKPAEPRSPDSSSPSVPGPTHQ